MVNNIDFQFIVKTYNFEEYILRYLFSVKYQIENFGSGRLIEIVIVDDCSTDDTMRCFHTFIERYQDLFKNVVMFVSKENCGVLKTHKTASNLINSDFFHIMDGDDFYSLHNIFEFTSRSNTYDYLFSPNLTFTQVDSKFKLKFNFKAYFRVRFISNKLSVLKDFSPIPNPGSWVSRAAMKYNKELEMEQANNYNLSNFYENELGLDGGDHLVWIILFTDLKFNYYFFDLPFVIRRFGSGVSTNINHPKFVGNRDLLLNEFYGLKLGPMFSSNSKYLKYLSRAKIFVDNIIFLLFNLNKSFPFFKVQFSLRKYRRFISDLEQEEMDFVNYRIKIDYE